MSWEVYTKALEIAAETKITTLNFFGGEPLVNPGVFRMLQAAFQKDFTVMLTTNCRPLNNVEFFAKFFDITRQFKQHIAIYTARDKFHLQHFDAAEIVNRLRGDGYHVFVQNYSDEIIAISSYNTANRELHKMNTGFSCCASSWKDNIGVLPDGGWTICPPSLEAFGNVFSDSLEDVLDFKRGLPFRYDKGCTRCLTDFKDFRHQFETRRQ